MKKPRLRAKSANTVQIDAETLRHASLIISGIIQSFTEPELVPLTDETRGEFMRRVYAASKLLSASRAWQTATGAAKRLKTQGKARK